MICRADYCKCGYILVNISRCKTVDNVIILNIFADYEFQIFKKCWKDI